MSKQIRLGSAQVNLLERLCNACAVAGDEGEVRKIVLEQVRPYAADVKVDALGNVLVTRLGNTNSDSPRLRVMLAAHMDEVGFMLTGDDEDGFFRLAAVGGLETSYLIGKTVWIGRDHVPGVIGAKPIHFISDDEFNQAITIDNLRVDVGPGNSSKVKVGDRGTFATSFLRSGNCLRAKALDDRLGVATLIELVKHALPNVDLLAAFTVQEEIGLRGARVAAYTFDPQLAIALDCTPARDFPVLERRAEPTRGAGFVPDDNPAYNTRLGGGPAIYLADRGTLSDPRLVRHFVESAEAAGIPYQFRQPGGGGTDAGAIHKQRAGIPSLSVSVPGRYIHTPAAIAYLDDWKNTLALVHTALERLSPGILDNERI